MLTIAARRAWFRYLLTVAPAVAQRHNGRRWEDLMAEQTQKVLVPATLTTRITHWTNVLAFSRWMTACRSSTPTRP